MHKFRCVRPSPEKHSSLDVGLLRCCSAAAAVKQIVIASTCFVPLALSAPGVYVCRSTYASKIWWHHCCAQVSSWGPTAVKFLQWASTRQDLFPKAMTDHLSLYQSRVPAHALPFLLRKFHRGLQQAGEPFGYIQPWPCGSGSVAQVYPVLIPVKVEKMAEPLYEEGVAKILRPCVRQRVKSDLKIMKTVASTIAKLLGESEQWLPLRQSVEQFENLLVPQTDLAQEARALQRFRLNFASTSSRGMLASVGGCIAVPRVFHKYSFQKALFESRERGVPFDRWLHSEAHLPRLLVDQNAPNRGLTRKIWRRRYRGDKVGPADAKELSPRLARMGLHMFLQMLIFDNFVHTDLHPGNLLIRWRREVRHPRGNVVGSVQDDPLPKVSLARKILGVIWTRRLFWLRQSYPRDTIELVLLDGGLTSTLAPRDRANFLDLFRAVAFGQGYQAGKLLLERSRKHECTNEEAFCSEVAKLVKHYVGPPLRLSNAFSSKQRFTMKNLRVGEVMQSILRTSLHYRVELDPAFVGVMLATVILEGVGRTLDPDIDLLAVARPFLDTILRGQSLMLVPPTPVRRAPTAL